MNRVEMGWTHIMDSIRSHSVCCVEHLVELCQSEEKQMVTKHGVDMLGVAVASGCMNMVKLVLSYIPYQENTAPINPFCIASFYGYCEIISYLHKYNPDFIKMTAPCSDLTCLMFAVVNNHTEATQLLLSLGANPYAKNANGETVLDMARSRELREILLSRTKLKVGEPKNPIRNSPMKLSAGCAMERKHKCSLTLSPYTPKRLKFLSPNKLREKTLKTKNLIWEKFRKRKHHGQLTCLLKEMGLSSYHELFRDQEIDSKTLFTLARNDLLELGIESDKEIANILEKINSYEKS